MLTRKSLHFVLFLIVGGFATSSAFPTPRPGQEATDYAFTLTMGRISSRR